MAKKAATKPRPTKKAAKPKKVAKAKTAPKPKEQAKAAPRKVSKVAAPTVAKFMTAGPHTIGRDQTLAHAHELMNKHRIRHLPVLDGGQLVGLLSQRDLYFVESLDNTTPAQIRVEEAMSTEVSETAATAPLQEVVQTLVREKHGCAVVTERGKVVGVFSTIDAMKALLGLLS
jgi:acetoin utilization protein AcuB